jgi:hypothetical protein
MTDRRVIPPIDPVRIEVDDGPSSPAIRASHDSCGNNRITDRRSDQTLGLCCGIDWATDHHDVAVLDDNGRVVARGRVSNDAAGFSQLLTLLAEAGDNATQAIPVGIETGRGLWVAALRETGRVVYPINPLAASRYRARHTVSGAKSDAADAVLLANIVRTDAAANRVRLLTSSWPKLSGYWPEPNKTRCGRASRSDKPTTRPKCGTQS